MEQTALAGHVLQFDTTSLVNHPDYEFDRQYCAGSAEAVRATETDTAWQDRKRDRNAELMVKVLGIVYRTLSTHLVKKAGFQKAKAQTGAVTLIQCFGSALNLNVQLTWRESLMPRVHGCTGAAHRLFLDGVYAEDARGRMRFTG